MCWVCVRACMATQHIKWQLIKTWNQNWIYITATNQATNFSLFLLNFYLEFSVLFRVLVAASLRRRYMEPMWLHRTQHFFLRFLYSDFWVNFSKAIKTENDLMNLLEIFLLGKIHFPFFRLTGAGCVELHLVGTRADRSFILCIEEIDAAECCAHVAQNNIFWKYLRFLGERTSMM